MLEKNKDTSYNFGLKYGSPAGCGAIKQTSEAFNWVTIADSTAPAYYWPPATGCILLATFSWAPTTGHHLLDA